MIVTLMSELFEQGDTDWSALRTLIDNGQHRYKVRLRPAYRPEGDRPFHHWIRLQPVDVQERVRSVLERGLKEREFTREIEVEVRCSSVDEWPDKLGAAPVRVSLSTAAKFLPHKLRLLLENGRNDWGFLKKVVPDSWRDRWERSVDHGWIEQDLCGGIDELRMFLEKEVALNEPRRIRTWTMFDSDADSEGALSESARKTQDVCNEWGIAYHLLQRRAIENYIPHKTLQEWAWRRPKANREQAIAAVATFIGLAHKDQYFFNMKQGIHRDLAPEIWGDNSADGPYLSLAEGLAGAGFNDEREKIFQSIFAML